MLLMFLIVCFGDVVPFKDLKITVKELQKFENFGEIRKVIRLESTPESLVGSISKALLDERHDIVYIGDFDSTKSIKAFTKEGRFLRTISRNGMGPGEFPHQLVDMALKSNGNLVVLTSRSVHEFSPDGHFIKQNKFSSYWFADITVLNGDMFINGITSDSNRTILQLGVDLGKKNIFGDKDPRREVYEFIPLETISHLGEEIWFLEFYEPTITVYNPNGERIKKITFTQLNKAEMDSAWNDKPFTEKSRTKIKDYVHRFELMFPCRDRMLVFEYNAKYPDPFNMYSFSKGKDVVLFKGYNPVRYSYREKSLVFSEITGHYSEGLLCSLEPDEYLMGIKNQYPKLKDTPIKEDDNPLLVLVRPY